MANLTNWYDTRNGRICSPISFDNPNYIKPPVRPKLCWVVWTGIGFWDGGSFGTHRNSIKPFCNGVDMDDPTIKKKFLAQAARFNVAPSTEAAAVK